MDPILPNLPAPQPPAPAAPSPPPPAEDAGSQALSDALRSSFFIVKIIMVALVLLFLGSGFFTVGPQQQAIVLRLGKPVGQGLQALLNPGFHWAFPSPIDEVIFVTNTTLHTVDSTVGWFQSPEDRAKGTPEPQMGNQLNPATTSYALTADTNIIHVVGALRYHITEPIDFLFNFTNAPFFITNALNNALLFAASQFRVDDILTSNRLAFKEKVTERVNELTDAEHLGIYIDQVDVDASPPLSLRNKFNEVDQAMINRNKLRNDAESYATTTLAKARGDAATETNVAQANRKRVVQMVQAQADTFVKLRGQFERDPAFFERIRQMAVLQQVYSNAQDRIIEPKASELRLQISRAPLEPSTNNYVTMP
jgi:membrane protease subunit HflK